MKTESRRVAPIRHWSAWLPLSMSLAALALVLVYAAVVGVDQHEDEGTPAHIYQLLMTAQLPIVLYFVIRWLPRQTRQALLVLVLQGAAWLAAIAALHWLEHLLPAGS